MSNFPLLSSTCQNQCTRVNISAGCSKLRSPRSSSPLILHGQPDPLGSGFPAAPSLLNGLGWRREASRQHHGSQLFPCLGIFHHQGLAPRDEGSLHRTQLDPPRLQHPLEFLPLSCWPPMEMPLPLIPTHCFTVFSSMPLWSLSAALISFNYEQTEDPDVTWPPKVPWLKKKKKRQK